MFPPEGMERRARGAVEGRRAGEGLERQTPDGLEKRQRRAPESTTDRSQEWRLGRPGTAQHREERITRGQGEPRDGRGELGDEPMKPRGRLLRVWPHDVKGVAGREDFGLAKGYVEIIDGDDETTGRRSQLTESARTRWPDKGPQEHRSHLRRQRMPRAELGRRAPTSPGEGHSACQKGHPRSLEEVPGEEGGHGLLNLEARPAERRREIGLWRGSVAK